MGKACSFLKIFFISTLLNIILNARAAQTTSGGKRLPSKNQPLKFTNEEFEDLQKPLLQLNGMFRESKRNYNHISESGANHKEYREIHNKQSTPDPFERLVWPVNGKDLVHTSILFKIEGHNLERNKLDLTPYRYKIDWKSMFTPNKQATPVFKYEFMSRLLSTNYNLKDGNRAIAVYDSSRDKLCPSGKCHILTQEGLIFKSVGHDNNKFTFVQSMSRRHNMVIGQRLLNGFESIREYTKPKENRIASRFKKASRGKTISRIREPLISRRSINTTVTIRSLVERVDIAENVFKFRAMARTTLITEQNRRHIFSPFVKLTSKKKNRNSSYKFGLKSKLLESNRDSFKDLNSRIAPKAGIMKSTERKSYRYQTQNGNIQQRTYYYYKPVKTRHSYISKLNVNLLSLVKASSKFRFRTIIVESEKALEPVVQEHEIIILTSDDNVTQKHEKLERLHSVEMCNGTGNESKLHFHYGIQNYVSSFVHRILKGLKWLIENILKYIRIMINLHKPSAFSGNILMSSTDLQKSQCSILETLLKFLNSMTNGNRLETSVYNTPNETPKLSTDNEYQLVFRNESQWIHKVSENGNKAGIFKSSVPIPQNNTIKFNKTYHFLRFNDMINGTKKRVRRAISKSDMPRRLHHHRHRSRSKPEGVKKDSTLQTTTWDDKSITKKFDKDQQKRSKNILNSTKKSEIYSFKKVDELNEKESDDLKNKLLVLMQLVRNNNKNLVTNSKLFNDKTEKHKSLRPPESEIKSTILPFDNIIGNGRKSNQHLHRHHQVTDADRRLLHNIELLTFLVLGRGNKSSNPHLVDANSTSHSFATERSNFTTKGNLSPAHHKHHLKHYKSGHRKHRRKNNGHLQHFHHKREIADEDPHLDFENDVANEYFKTADQSNTLFPQKWKTLKKQLAYLDKQVVNTNVKYNKIQAHIKHLLVEGEGLSDRVSKRLMKMGKTNAKEEIQALKRIERQRKKIAKKIEQEELKRIKLASAYQRTGVAKKVDDVKGALMNEDHPPEPESITDLNFDDNSSDLPKIESQYMAAKTSNGSLSDIVFLDPELHKLKRAYGTQILDALQPVTPAHAVDRDLAQVDNMLDNLLQHKLMKRSAQYPNSRWHNDHAIKHLPVHLNRQDTMNEGSRGEKESKDSYPSDQISSPGDSSENKGGGKEENIKGDEQDNYDKKEVTEAEKGEGENVQRNKEEDINNERYDGGEKESDKMSVNVDGEEIGSNKENGNDKSNDNIQSIKPDNTMKANLKSKSKNRKDYVSKSEDKDEYDDMDDENIKMFWAKEKNDKKGTSQRKNKKEKNGNSKSKKLDDEMEMFETNHKIKKTNGRKDEEKLVKALEDFNDENNTNATKKLFSSMSKENNKKIKDFDDNGSMKKQNKSVRKLYRKLDKALKDAIGDLKKVIRTRKVERILQRKRFKQMTKDYEASFKDVLQDFRKEMKWLTKMRSRQMKRHDTLLLDALKDLHKRQKDVVAWKRAGSRAKLNAKRKRIDGK